MWIYDRFRQPSRRQLHYWRNNTTGNEFGNKSAFPTKQPYFEYGSPYRPDTDSIDEEKKGWSKCKVLLVIFGPLLVLGILAALIVGAIYGTGLNESSPSLQYSVTGEVKINDVTRWPYLTQLQDQNSFEYKEYQRRFCTEITAGMSDSGVQTSCFVTQFRSGSIYINFIVNCVEQVASASTSQQQTDLQTAKEKVAKLIQAKLTDGTGEVSAVQGIVFQDDINVPLPSTSSTTSTSTTSTTTTSTSSTTTTTTTLNPTTTTTTTTTTAAAVPPTTAKATLKPTTQQAQSTTQPLQAKVDATTKQATTQPAATTQQATTQPAAATQAPTTQPVADTQAPTTQPAATTQAPATQPAATTQQATTQPAAATQAPATQPAATTQAPATTQTPVFIYNVSGNATITNWQYVTDLNDSNSQAFKEKEQIFCDSVRNGSAVVNQTISTCVVNAMRNGSIKIEYTVTKENQQPPSKPLSKAEELLQKSALAQAVAQSLHNPNSGMEVSAMTFDSTGDNPCDNHNCSFKCVAEMFLPKCLCNTTHILSTDGRSCIEMYPHIHPYRQTELTEGDTVSNYCILISNLPTATLTWIDPSGQPISNDFGRTYVNAGPRNGRSALRLELNGVLLSDAGSYVCVANYTDKNGAVHTMYQSWIVKVKECRDGYFLCTNDGPVPDTPTSAGSDSGQSSVSGPRWKRAVIPDVCSATPPSSMCLANTLRCDGKRHCPTGSDEVDCSNCGDGMFECRNGLCVSNRTRCDGVDDCYDASDEFMCPRKNCNSYEFQCIDGSCISSYRVCDRTCDCGRPSCEDELGCSCTASYEYLCRNTGLCIRTYNLCDRTDNCGDHEDEKNCSYSCYSFQHRCPDGFCISNFNLCNGANDCGDWSDEQQCHCSEDQFKCSRTGVCVSKSKYCDGVQDCPMGEDETEFCHTNCFPRPYQFSCDDKCIAMSSVCDGYSDCTNHVDETQNCSCSEEQMRCSDGLCIDHSLYCDCKDDCIDGSDEPFDCTLTCPPDYHQCADGACINPKKLCNRIIDCKSGEDEIKCECSVAEFRCDNGICVHELLWCDGVNHCIDGSDEKEKCALECPPNQILCDNRCIPSYEMCDGTLHCSSYADERNCTCNESMVQCAMGMCIPKTAWCDGSRHCPDNSDEQLGCTCQNDYQFDCNAGTGLPADCIANSSRCDGSYHCSNRNDERFCGCRTGYKECTNTGLCVWSSYFCNGYDNCGDWSDEINCTCSSNEFQCKVNASVTQFPDVVICKNVAYWCDGYAQHCPLGEDEEVDCHLNCPSGGRSCIPSQRCIRSYDVCDGYTHCPDDSDELNCNCTSYQRKCQNTKCVYNSGVCNGYNDCGDWSDEVNCTCSTYQCAVNASVTNVTDVSICLPSIYYWCDGYNHCPLGDDEPEGCVRHCQWYERRCPGNNKTCTHWSNFCDGYNQCGDYSDEIGCTCSSTKVMCPILANSTIDQNVTLCIPKTLWCDGNAHCPNGTDELPGCSANCTDAQFSCKEKCIPNAEVCDGVHDCAGGEDESDKACGNITVYLTHGSYGRVEIVRNGVKGTVCDDSWGSTDCQVVCRQLGLSGGYASCCARYGAGTGVIWLDNVFCTGSESKLYRCQHSGWGVHNCGHGEDASCSCTVPSNATTPTAPPTPSTTPTTTNLPFLCTFETDLCGIFQWQNDVFDWTRYSGSTSSTGTGPSGAAMGSYYAYIEATSRSVGDRAYFESPAITTSGTVCLSFYSHLYDSSLRSMGELRVFTSYSNESNYIFTSNTTRPQGNIWKKEMFTVYIRSMEKIVFLGIRGTAYQSDIAIDHLQITQGACSGLVTSTPGPNFTTNIPNCIFPFLPCGNGRCLLYFYFCDGINQCGDWSDEPIYCPNNTVTTTPIPTRVPWNRTTTTPRQYVTTIVTTTRPNCSFPFLPCGNGRCVLYIYICDGINHCGDWSDEPIFCPSNVTTPIPMTTNVPSNINVSLSMGTYGRVEITRNGVRGTVCDDNWGNSDCQVVCRMLGLSGGISLCCAAYGQGTGVILLDEVGCFGTESSLSQCSHRGWGVSDCSHGEDASCRCSAGSTTPQPNTTRPATTNLPFLCTFEADFCGIFQRQNDTFDWLRHSGSTSSSGTGPSSAAMGRYYVYTEASNPRVLGDRAYLESPSINSSGEVCLSFYSHLYDVSLSGMGELRVFKSYSNESNYIFTSNTTRPQGNIWRWQAFTVNIRWNERIIFLAIRGNGFESDIAIDHLQITQGACSVVSTPQPWPNVTTTRPSCSSFFDRRCDNGNCVRSYYFCNGNNECGDWSDERNCNCSSSQFQCLVNANVTTIPNVVICKSQSFWCNGYRECPLGDDEQQDCTQSCPPGTFPCAADQYCMSSNYLCDGYLQCSDGADESNCTCTSMQFECPAMDNTTLPSNVTLCLSNSAWCDGFPNCPNGTDESPGCVNNCPAGSRACYPSNRCLPSLYICDGYRHCADGSDEFHCNCTASETRCPNTMCLHAYATCNGFNDCGDWSDEVNCNCSSSQFECPKSDNSSVPANVTICRSSWNWCDGYSHCPDGTDEPPGCVYARPPLMANGAPEKVNDEPEVDTTCGKVLVKNPSEYGSSEKTTTTVKEWPWMASLQVNGKHECDGVIIDNSWILSTNCNNSETFKRSNLKIKVGDNVMMKESEDNVFDVDIIKRYSPQQSIVMVKLLDDKIQYDVDRSPICMPNDNLLQDLNCSITGFVNSEIKQYPVKLWNSDKCKDFVNHGTKHLITQNYICATFFGKNTFCDENGYQGTLFCSANGRQWFIKGVGMSLPATDCSYPVRVYLDMEDLKKWVEETVRA